MYCQNQHINSWSNLLTTTHCHLSGLGFLTISSWLWLERILILLWVTKIKASNESWIFFQGAKLGISTMAAAAFGNTISDMMGIGSAWYVESWADRLGKLISKNISAWIKCTLWTERQEHFKRFALNVLLDFAFSPIILVQHNSVHKFTLTENEIGDFIKQNFSS